MVPRLLAVALAVAGLYGCATTGAAPGSWAERAQAPRRPAAAESPPPADALTVSRPLQIVRASAAGEPSVEALVAAAAPRPRRTSYGQLWLSTFGATADDDGDDSGAVDAWLDECERRAVECWVDKPGRYRTPNLRYRNFRGDVRIVFVDGAYFDGEGELPLSLWSVESSQEWINYRFVNWGIVWTVSPRPGIDDGWSSRNDAHGALRPALDHDLDHFRAIGGVIDGCVAAANFQSGGAYFKKRPDGHYNTTFSPKLEHNPLIREVVIEDTVVRNCGGGWELAMSRWGSADKARKGTYMWRITGNLVEDIRPDLHGCEERMSFCGQAFQVGHAGTGAWQAENGGLLFEGNTIRRLFDYRRSRYTENQGLNVQAGGIGLVRKNVFDTITGMNPRRRELNQECIYSKAYDLVIEQNTFRNCNFYEAESAVFTVKSGPKLPEPPGCVDCMELVYYSTEAGLYGGNNVFRNNLIVWDRPETPRPDDPPVTGPKIVIAAVAPGTRIVGNTFRGFTGYDLVCNNNNRCPERKLIYLRKYGGQIAEDNVVEPSPEARAPDRARLSGDGRPL